MPFDLDEKFIAQTEEKLGARLPENYRKAMMSANGGEIGMDEDDWEQYPILDTSDKKRLSRTSNDVITETRSCRGWDGFPENAVAVAKNGFGDQMVFLKTGDVFGPDVYFWSHETRELSKLADDFSELHRL